ncbi:histidine phosphatase superfamily [Triangularia setosa]|uniref:Histidine phosphatase superfamily n=1 Tax=Triangularia setosa TaxID=2587417 RepID=A0AAN6WBR7_9PEZI|nr:histidine phosphatase superfamily [Podospora setosa]
MDGTQQQPDRQRRDVSSFWGSSKSFLALGLSVVLITALLVQLLNQDLISSTEMMHNALPGVASLTAAVLAYLGVAHVSDTTDQPGNDNFAIDLSWYPQRPSPITNLTTVINSTGVWGFIYNTSHTPDSQYGTYNWCNMPHVRAKEYPKPPSEYELLYVEVIHRHHLRTPYSSNAFPIEPEPWNCNDIALFSYSSPLSPSSPPSTPAYHSPFTSPLNPFPPSPIGLQGTCEFPQITLPGLTDSHQHGLDLLSVYAPLISPETVAIHVTNNPITTQVAGALLSALLPSTSRTPLLVQNKEIDPLEPQYPCPSSRHLFSRIQSTPEWKSHLSLAKPLFEQLDKISGVPPTDSGFHKSVDHYYDNLSSKQCHSRPLLLRSVTSPDDSIPQEMADAVYRLGQWEYHHLYRGSPDSLKASVASYGVWIAELVSHIQQPIKGQGEVKYRHNIAHDGSISRLLGVLQVEQMHWPGMGAEIVFEIYKLKTKYFVRVLYGGQVLKSSSPMLKGDKNGMTPVGKVVGYLGGLIGLREQGGGTRHDVRRMCNAPVTKI